MCGRFTQNYSWREVHDFLNFLVAPLNPQPRYNIAPTTRRDVSD
jgi:putative SOS response-associated peptidase YedK